MFLFFYFIILHQINDAYNALRVGGAFKAALSPGKYNSTLKT